MPRLPDKLSDLLELSLNDAAKINQLKRFKLNMWSWVTPGLDGHPCEVCLAGAVMLHTLGMVPDHSLDPEECGKMNQKKLLAVDAMRNGDFAWAYKLINGKQRDFPITYEVYEELDERLEEKYDWTLKHIPPVRGGRRAWWMYWRRIVVALREDGA